MQYPTVVVGIATHNRAGLLRKAISSALDQSYRPLRIAIVDDGSSDHTPALRDEFAELSWERWEQAQGYVKARNQMMLSASEDYFVSLDDDAWFIDGNEIAIAIEFMECRPSVATAHGGCGGCGCGHGTPKGLATGLFCTVEL
jgi:glycosyltransferase involved in cell wall biosynthesis